eukprot:UN4987
MDRPHRAARPGSRAPWIAGQRPDPRKHCPDTATWPAQLQCAAPPCGHTVWPSWSPVKTLGISPDLPEPAQQRGQINGWRGRSTAPGPCSGTARSARRRGSQPASSWGRHRRPSPRPRCSSSSCPHRPPRARASRPGASSSV